MTFGVCIRGIAYIISISVWIKHCFFFVRLKIPDFQLIFQFEKIHLKKKQWIGWENKNRNPIERMESFHFVNSCITYSPDAHTHTCDKMQAEQARIIPIKNENHSFPLKLKHIVDAIRETYIASVVAAQKD